LSSKVEQFLESGSPPIYAGFGSMISRKPGKILRLIVQAARAVGRRVVVARGWSERVDENLGDDCLVVDEAPHPLLFPRVSAVVHHGGSGTTASAARAGIPQVIVPHILDQYYWANAVWSRGLGPEPIPRNRLSGKRLSAALRECLCDEEMHQRVEELGRTLRGENGLARAVEIIESGFFHRDTRPPD
jgi:UDP:flavonoid glycosyltransferase YjiC (YdhE family)